MTKLSFNTLHLTQILVKPEKEKFNLLTYISSEEIDLIKLIF